MRYHYEKPELKENDGKQCLIEKASKCSRKIHPPLWKILYGIFLGGIDMMNKKNAKRIKRYFRRTLKNKLCAIILFVTGVASTFIDGNITFLVFATLFAIPLFFARENWIC